MLGTIHLFYDCVLDFYHRGVSICFLIKVEVYTFLTRNDPCMLKYGRDN